MVLAALLALTTIGTASPAQDGAPPEDAALALVRAAESRRVAVLERAARSVVCIFVEGETRAGGGSGVLISADGIGLTNFHVVADFLATRRGVGGLSDGRLYPLRVLGIDPGGDIVAFQLSGRERFDHAPLGDSDALRVGQWVAAMGNPFLVAEDYTPTITLGIISGLHRYQEGQQNLLEYADCIQVSTSINPGNSGGPLFDMDGRLIGINGRASFEERGRVNVGLGYAVTINQVRRFLPGLRAGRLMQHGTLGATVRVSGERLIFAAIQDFSPAEKAGVQLGDELLAVCGRPVRTANEFNNRIAILPAQWPVALSVRRDGAIQELHARLEALPLRAGLVYPPDADVNRAEVRRLLAPFAASGDDGARLPAAWEGRLTLRDADGERSANVRIAPAPEGGTRVAAEWAGEPPAGWDAGQFESEWSAIVAPLLGARDLDEQCEALTGDELDGRIVARVQRRLPDQRLVRWHFDADVGDLRAATLGTPDNPADVTWTVSDHRDLGDRRWPTHWARRQGATALELRLDRPLEPAPDARPSATPEGGAP